MKLERSAALPKRIRTLRDPMAKWASREALRGDDLVMTSKVAFVRHNCTNYEAILGAHQARKGASEDDAAPWAIEHANLRRDVKRRATQPAERMPTEAYGDRWQ